MADDPNAASAAPEAAPAGPPSAAAQLQIDVVTAIAAGTPGVRGRVVTSFAEEELKKRELALFKCCNKLIEARTELKKLNNGGKKSLNRDGSVAHHTFEKKELEDIKKKDAEVKKIEDAIAKALDEKNPDYSKVKEIANSGGGGGGGGEAPAPAAAE